MLIGQRCCCDYNDDSDDNADKIMLDNDDIFLIMIIALQL